MTFTFTQEQLLPYTPQQLFPLFADAVNLERITPPELHFQILTPLPIHMDKGTLIDYELRLFGIPFRWRTRIAAWQPPFMFADEQLKGPYALWYHTHTFTAVEGGTLMTDTVRYKLPLGVFGLCALPLVRVQIQRIFQYRKQAIDQIVHQFLAASAR